MTDLSTQELAQLRTAAENYLSDTCTIRKVTRSDDGQGGFTETWSDRASGVACRLASVRSQRSERPEGEQLAAYSRWVLTIPHDQAIEESDRVVHDGETYEVAHLEDTHSNRTAKRVWLRRLD